MHWYDGRFAGSEALQFQLFNQMMRHKVISNVNAHLNGTKGDVDALITMVEDPGFEHELRQEIRGLEKDGKKISARGREMLSVVERACKISGQRVPWTKAERCGTTALITALSQRFGCGAVFITVSPPQHDSPLAIRLSLDGDDRIDEVVELEPAEEGSKTPSLDWTLKFPELSERLNLIARNPISDAKAYEKVVNAFWTALVQCCPVGDTRSTSHELENKKRGAFGYTRAFFGITECRTF